MMDFMIPILILFVLSSVPNPGLREKLWKDTEYKTGEHNERKSLPERIHTKESDVPRGIQGEAKLFLQYE